MADLIYSYVNESSVEQCSETRSGAARISLSDARSDNESLHAASIVDQGHQGLNPSDAREMTRINLLSDVGCNSDSMDVSNDISSCIEQFKVEGLTDLGGENIPGTLYNIRLLTSLLRSKVVSATI